MKPRKTTDKKPTRTDVRELRAADLRATRGGFEGAEHKLDAWQGENS